MYKSIAIGCLFTIATILAPRGRRCLGRLLVVGSGDIVTGIVWLTMQRLHMRLVKIARRDTGSVGGHRPVGNYHLRIPWRQYVAVGPALIWHTVKRHLLSQITALLERLVFLYCVAQYFSTTVGSSRYESNFVQLGP